MQLPQPISPKSFLHSTVTRRSLACAGRVDYVAQTPPVTVLSASTKALLTVTSPVGDASV